MKNNYKSGKQLEYDPDNPENNESKHSDIYEVGNKPFSLRNGVFRLRKMNLFEIYEKEHNSCDDEAYDYERVEHEHHDTRNMVHGNRHNFFRRSFGSGHKLGKSAYL